MNEREKRWAEKLRTDETATNDHDTQFEAKELLSDLRYTSNHIHGELNKHKYNPPDVKRLRLRVDQFNKQFDRFEELGGVRAETPPARKRDDDDDEDEQGD